MAQAFVRGAATTSRPPPLAVRGFVKRLRDAFFSSPASVGATLAGLALAVWMAPTLIRFLFVDAVWRAADGAPCRAPGAGACWAYVGQKLSYFMYASYPREDVWRVDATLVLGAVLLGWLLWPAIGRKGLGAALFFLIYPIVGFVLLHGAAALGLRVVPTDLWGGVFVSLLVAIVGIVASLPIGILLALARRSRLPVVRAAAIGFIEVVRGVPLITVLFMANTMLPLFVPEALSPDRLARPLIAVVVFASAYMAEVVRGGLQAVSKGQYEGAAALGLGYVATMRLVVLPQALAYVIPGIVNTFIGLFKDTTLVAVVGISDFLRTVDTARADAAWAGPTISGTGYIFAAAFYFVFCFGMSRYSLAMERRLRQGRQR